MKQLTFIFLISIIVTTTFAQGTRKEQAVKVYYAGFKMHNWNTVVSQFADGFTFTSPNNDDHIPLKQFKEKCWPTNGFIKKVNFIKMSESGNCLFLLVEITTSGNKVVRNVDVYTFEGGKIKSIETFFGPGDWFPGNKR